MATQHEMPTKHLDAFFVQIKIKSDKLINYFMCGFFLCGLLLAPFYDTWDVALGVGSLSLIAYYSTKLALPKSDLYQYVLSIVFAVFMAQFIFQMHGLFEMHFIAFVGSTILITYQNWRLQIPIGLTVMIHHGVFGYLQYIGYDKIYFTQLDYMDLQTFAIHGILAGVIFFICGLWAYHFRKYSMRHIRQTYHMGKLEEERKQKEALLELSSDLKQTNEKLNEAQHIAAIGSWTWDLSTNQVQRSDEFYNIIERGPSEIKNTPQSFVECLHPDDRERVTAIVNSCVAASEPFAYEARVLMPDDGIKVIFAQGKIVKNSDGAVRTMAGTIQDITTRKAHEDAIEKSNEELRKSHHELDKFVYSVSHDLRAPLLSMQGVVDITEDLTAEELTARHMQMLRGSISRLDKFIADILDYSRNSRMEIVYTPIDVKDVLNEITNDLQYMAPDCLKENISLDVKQEGSFCTDGGRFRIIMNNLISNAIRYHNPAATASFVKIRAQADSRYSQIEVEDNGIGIPEEYQHRVFDMFYRVSEKSSGSGLGLYIVKETVEKLRGEISLESRAGVGTKFTVTIPNLTYQ